MKLSVNLFGGETLTSISLMGIHSWRSVKLARSLGSFNARSLRQEHKTHRSLKWNAENSGPTIFCDEYKSAVLCLYTPSSRLCHAIWSDRSRVSLGPPMEMV